MYIYEWTDKVRYEQNHNHSHSKWSRSVSLTLTLFFTSSVYPIHCYCIKLWNEVKFSVINHTKSTVPMPKRRYILLVYSLKNMSVEVFFLPVWLHPLVAAGTQCILLCSVRRVPQWKPLLLVQHVFLQPNVGCNNKSLFALHCHFQHLFMQCVDISVLQLWIKSRKVQHLGHAVIWRCLFLLHFRLS